MPNAVAARAAGCNTVAECNPIEAFRNGLPRGRFHVNVNLKRRFDVDPEHCPNYGGKPEAAHP
jgi:hypothetical protein